MTFGRISVIFIGFIVLNDFVHVCTCYMLMKSFKKNCESSLSDKRVKKVNWLPEILDGNLAHLGIFKLKLSEPNSPDLKCYTMQKYI